MSVTDDRQTDGRAIANSERSLKINGQYYRDVLLMQKLLPAIRSIAGDVFLFQQDIDNAPAHRARDTVELLRQQF